jgi:hypothetical protein
MIYIYINIFITIYPKAPKASHMEAFGQRGPQRPYIYVAPKGLTYQINPQLLFQ